MNVDPCPLRNLNEKCFFADALDQSHGDEINRSPGRLAFKRDGPGCGGVNATRITT